MRPEGGVSEFTWASPCDISASLRRRPEFRKDEEKGVHAEARRRGGGFRYTQLCGSAAQVSAANGRANGRRRTVALRQAQGGDGGGVSEARVSERRKGFFVLGSSFLVAYQGRRLAGKVKISAFQFYLGYALRHLRSASSAFQRLKMRPFEMLRVRTAWGITGGAGKEDGQSA